MATLLKLPLSVNSSGMLEYAQLSEEMLQPRLKAFLLSGLGEYLRLPSQGIRQLWIQLYVMGASERFAKIVGDTDRERLERIIRDEVNAWLEGCAEITRVKILGDKDTENGIEFQTRERKYGFIVRYADSKQPAMIGSWNIIETSDVVK